MRLRIKFSKTGSMKFIGHLDIMRYFQKALRRAGIDVAFSGGFSPHMLMSFAQPLGLGATSSGEYFDLDVNSCGTTAEIREKLNAQMVPEIQVLQVVKIPEDRASKGMTLVAAADYLVRFRDPSRLPEHWREELQKFLGQEQIFVIKSGKNGEKEWDIRPFLYQMEAREDGLFLRLSAGSQNNLKPETAAEAFAAFLGVRLPEHALMIHREELYAETSAGGVIPLGELGEELE